MRLLVISKSNARPEPSSRGRIQVMPCSPIKPRLRNTVVKLAALEAMRTSHLVAKTKPPPAATPFTAPMIGLGTVKKYENSPGRSSAALDREPGVEVSASTVLINACESSPGEKAR